MIVELYLKMLLIHPTSPPGTISTHLKVISILPTVVLSSPALLIWSIQLEFFSQPLPKIPIKVLIDREFSINMQMQYPCKSQ